MKKGLFWVLQARVPSAVNRAFKRRLRRLHNVNVPSVLRLDTPLTTLEIFVCDAKNDLFSNYYKQRLKTPPAIRNFGFSNKIDYFLGIWTT